MFMVELKVRTIGNSTGVTFPKEVVDRLKIKSGDTVYLTESPDGYRLTPYHPEFARQMEVAESVMRRYKDALRELAK
jgi:putative addiction module antidote